MSAHEKENDNVATTAGSAGAAHDMWEAYWRTYRKGVERHGLEAQIMQALDGNGGTMGAEALREKVGAKYLVFADALRGLADRERLRLLELDEPSVTRI